MKVISKLCVSLELDLKYIESKKKKIKKKKLKLKLKLNGFLLFNFLIKTTKELDKLELEFLLIFIVFLSKLNFISDNFLRIYLFKLLICFNKDKFTINGFINMASINTEKLKDFK